MAIIDILTPYDTKKKAAHAAKTVKHGVSSPCPSQAQCGPSDSQAPCFRRLSLPLSRDREQEEQVAWLPAVLPPMCHPR